MDYMLTINYIVQMVIAYERNDFDISDTLRLMDSSSIIRFSLIYRLALGDSTRINNN